MKTLWILILALAALVQAQDIPSGPRAEGPGSA
jgi:hypothetical protein